MQRRGLAVVSNMLAAYAFAFAIAPTCHAAPSLQITLSTPKKSYVIGEPVPLEVVAKNTSQEVIKTYDIIDHSYASCPEFGIYIAREDEGFRSYTPGDCIQADIAPRRVFDLKPNDTVDYQLRILYANAPPSNLAFPRPGAYRINVEHPQLRGVKSNTIDIRVTEPEGADAEIWGEIQSQKFLYFLHWGGIAKKDADVAMRAAELLKSYPESSYHDDLRWALRAYYRRNPGLGEHEKELIREVAEIAAPAPNLLERDDRLDRVVTFHFPEEVPLGEAIQKLSRQSRVPLEIHPKLKDWGITSARVTRPLREFMEPQAAGTAEWFRQGDGYLLAPEDWDGEADE